MPCHLRSHAWRSGVSLWVVVDHDSHNLLGEFETWQDAWDFASSLEGSIEIYPPKEGE